MLRISKLTDYGTILLARLASAPEQRMTATQLAAQTHLALPTVSKLLKTLQRRGLVGSTRGLHGGYRLQRSAQQISAADILEALEGPMALTECASDHSHCGLEPDCRVSTAWQRLNLAVHQSLREINLTELAGHVGSGAAPVRAAAVAVHFRRAVQS